MQCPNCGSSASAVVDSRYRTESRQKRRKRKCKDCGKTFMTLEQLEVSPVQRLRVIKRDGRREAFSNDKLRNGVQIAVAKRPVSTERVEYLVQEVGRRLVKTGNAEFESDYIGDIVMRLLIRLDRVAYVRFASVYRNFREVGAFRRAVEHAEQGTHPRTTDAQGRFAFAEDDRKGADSNHSESRPGMSKGRKNRAKSNRSDRAQSGSKPGSDKSKPGHA